MHRNGICAINKKTRSVSNNRQVKLLLICIIGPVCELIGQTGRRAAEKEGLKVQQVRVEPLIHNWFRYL